MRMIPTATVIPCTVFTC